MNYSRVSKLQDKNRMLNHNLEVINNQVFNSGTKFCDAFFPKKKKQKTKTKMVNTSLKQE